MASQSLALLAIAVLLISALGPMLDHHFAERHPAHGHLYLVGETPNHFHPFEHSHIHYDVMYSPVPGPESIVFFSPNDGAGHAPADIVISVVAPPPVYSDDGAPLLGNRLDPAALLRGRAVLPLRQPPKA